MTNPFKTFSLRRGKRKRMPQKETQEYKTACKLRSSQRWRNLRAMYLRRNPLCQDCAKVAGVEVHHVMGVTRYPELCFEETNLRALCVRCHEIRHRRRK